MGINFNYAFEKFENDYEYWFFSEDDYLLTQVNYFGESIKQLDMDKSTAFICACQHEQNITNDDIILDIGPKTLQKVAWLTHKNFEKRSQNSGL